jgi:hypothetical protein
LLKELLKKGLASLEMCWHKLKELDPEGVVK